MGLESADWISELVESNPVGATDDRSTSDDHHRLEKTVIRNSFAGHTKAISLFGSISGTNTYTMSVTMTGTLAYSDGMTVIGAVANANTSTTPSLNINSLGAKTIYRQGGTALFVGDIPAAGRCVFVYDANLSGFVLMNPVDSNLLQAVYPVGSIYMSSVSTNPATLFGFGTWAAEAAGRTLVGVGTSDATYSAGATGGESTHTLTESEMPAHDHGGGSHTHSIPGNDSGVGSVGALSNQDPYNTRYTGSSGAIINSQGGGSAHNNMPPYQVRYIWRRTA